MNEGVLLFIYLFEGHIQCTQDLILVLRDHYW